MTSSVASIEAKLAQAEKLAAAGRKRKAQFVRAAAGDVRQARGMILNRDRRPVRRDDGGER